ncbi:substrate-binding domain-containing protein, partial [Deinococcus sp.]|uniref:LacI family DNA-binding transcriptional regulator n=1 Tax=Deinococcus sp. TaxID=47478 RepID=UPI00286986F3
SAERELEELRRLYGQRVAGIMLRPGYGPHSRDYLARLAARDVAIVEYDYVHSNSPYPSVMLDNRGAMSQAVKYLHDLGHRDVAALGTYHPVIHPEERSRTFPEAMNALGLTVPTEYQRVTMLNEESAYVLTHELLSLPQPPSALIALTGTQAVGAYRSIQERGLRIPQDLSLLTFDNYPWTALVDPPITVLEQPAEDMATATVHKLLRLLDGDPVTEPHEIFPARLIVRGSCSAPGVPAPTLARQA